MISLLSVDPGDYVHTNSFKQMFIADLWVRAKSGNNPKVYQLKKGLNNIGYIQTVREYSAIRSELWYTNHNIGESQGNGVELKPYNIVHTG